MLLLLLAYDPTTHVQRPTSRDEMDAAAAAANAANAANAAAAPPPTTHRPSPLTYAGSVLSSVVRAAQRVTVQTLQGLVRSSNSSTSASSGATESVTPLCPNTRVGMLQPITKEDVIALKWELVVLVASLTLFLAAAADMEWKVVLPLCSLIIAVGALTIMADVFHMIRHRKIKRAWLTVLVLDLCILAASAGILVLWSHLEVGTLPASVTGIAYGLDVLMLFLSFMTVAARLWLRVRERQSSSSSSSSSAGLNGQNGMEMGLDRAGATTSLASGSGDHRGAIIASASGGLMKPISLSPSSASASASAPSSSSPPGMFRSAPGSAVV